MMLGNTLWVSAYELEQSGNMASISYFPTAFDQPTATLVRTGLEFEDIKEPIINLSNALLGLQWRNLNLGIEGNFQLEPEYEFDYMQARLKARVVNLDEFRTYMAFGILGRWVPIEEERLWRIDDRPASLFAILSIELFPMDDWGGVLFNFYLDNRYFSSGFKVQLYPSIQALGEFDYLHDTWRQDKISGRGGLEFYSEENFFFQLLYSDVGHRWFSVIGMAF